MRFSLGVFMGLVLAGNTAPAAPPEQGLRIFHREGELNSQAHGLDANGNVFGLRDVRNPSGHSEKGFWHGADGSDKMIPPLPGYVYSYPYAIAAKSGVVVGRAGRPPSQKDGSMQAFAWNPATGAIEGLGFLEDDLSSVAWSVSADGNTVAGHSIGPAKGIRPCVWTHAGKGWKSTELAAPLDDNPLLSTTGLRISPDGKKAVGALTFKIVEKRRVYISHLYQWDKAADGTWTRAEISDRGIATAVNDSGTVIGYFGAADGEHAFVYTKKNGLSDIGVLPGSKGSRATGLNNGGTVIGHSGRAGYERAFVWKDGKMEALTLPKDILLSAAFGINERGQVAGYLGGENDSHVSSFVTSATK